MLYGIFDIGIVGFMFISFQDGVLVEVIECYFGFVVDVDLNVVVVVEFEVLEFGSLFLNFVNYVNIWDNMCQGVLDLFNVNVLL